MRTRIFDKEMTRIDVGTAKGGELNIAQAGRARCMVIATMLESPAHERAFNRALELERAKRKKASGTKSKIKK